MIKRLSIFCGLFLALPLLAGTLSVADYGALVMLFVIAAKQGLNIRALVKWGSNSITQ